MGITVRGVHGFSPDTDPLATLTGGGRKTNEQGMLVIERCFPGDNGVSLGAPAANVPSVNVDVDEGDDKDLGILQLPRRPRSSSTAGHRHE